MRPQVRLQGLCPGRGPREISAAMARALAETGDTAEGLSLQIFLLMSDP
jgi:hypothetical protein